MAYNVHQGVISVLQLGRHDSPIARLLADSCLK
eukprot:CAMPEP_0184387210 /NCGR_PEP_ID=MMETSP0007-20130409/10536_1 /TAXON_ID=97485 /ORGANISM="Prymnesium parvum, Strain Texoma1" /LENGTH=32 /DNA_ID= /DNA_START= /DNA_END= /DNA_ORIENTATION=